MVVTVRPFAETAWPAFEEVSIAGLAPPDAQGLDAVLEQTVAWWRNWADSLTLGSRDEPRPAG